MTVGVICAAMAESTVSSVWCALCAIPRRWDQRSATVWSAPRKPLTLETPLVRVAASNVPFSNWTSVSAPAACAVTAAIVAMGPVNEIWFHGSARRIRATTSNLKLYRPGREATSR